MKPRILVLLLLVLVLSATLVACNDEPPVGCNHQWTLGELTTASGCGTDGVRTKTCLLCNETRDFVEPATEAHTWDEGVQTAAASCGENGSVKYTCTVCQEALTLTIPATGEHTFSDTKTLKTTATCGAPGAYARACTTCGYEATSVIPPTGEHVAASTFVDDGDTHYRPCTICHQPLLRKIHAWDEGEVIQDVSGCKSGIKRSTCTDCGKTAEIELPSKRPHTASISVDTATGLMHLTCSVCSNVSTYTVDRFYDMQNNEHLPLIDGGGKNLTAKTNPIVKIEQESGDNSFLSVTQGSGSGRVQAQNNSALIGGVENGVASIVLSMDMRLAKSSNGSADFSLQFFNAGGTQWNVDRGLKFLKNSGNQLQTASGVKLCNLSTSSWTKLRIEFTMDESNFVVRYFVNDTFVTQATIQNTMFENTFTAIYFSIALTEPNTGYHFDNIVYAHK